MHDRHMNHTARELIEDIRDSLRILSDKFHYGSLAAAMREVSALSGVSVSLIHKVYDGRANNPTADTIDKLRKAMRLAAKRLAA